MKKRFLIIFLSLVCALCLCFGLTACGGNSNNDDSKQNTEQPDDGSGDGDSETPEHTHSYKSSITAPTCTERGYTTYTCSCGDSYVSDYTSALGHNYTVSWSYAEDYSYATATFICSRCDDVQTEDAETVVTEAKDATCTAAGEIKLSVSITFDGETYTDEQTITIEMIPHTYGDDNICTVCGHEKDPSEGLAYTLASNAYYVIGIGTCTDTQIIIPSTYNDLPVIGIADSAFNGQTQIKSIIIPDSVTAIGGSAFYGCTSLKSLTIGEGVTTIGERAFYNCKALTEINYNATNASLGSYVFYCAGQSGSGITVNIGAKVTIIPANLFYCGDTTGMYAKVKTITFAEGSVCESIGVGAFYKCSSLETINIPASIISIGEDAFYNCTALSKVYITDLTAWCGISFGGERGVGGNAYNDTITHSNPLAYAKAFYLNDELVTNLVIPDSITEIKAYAFYSNKSITSVTISSNVKTIGCSAFSGSEALKSVTIPDSVTYIGYGAFSVCSALEEVTLGSSLATIDEIAFYNCQALKSITIPNNVTTIGERAFESCKALTSVTIGDGVTSIGVDAFSMCYSLKTVAIGSNVTSIDSGTFSYCTALTTITIPNNVTSIGYQAFYGCTALKSVTIPNSVTSMGNQVFYGCTALENITIPDGITAISTDTFYNCTSLTSITIPSNVTSIGSYAFYGCTKLTSITIPDSVTSIGTSAFYGCTKLATVYNYSNLTLTAGDTANGYVAYYATSVFNNLMTKGDYIFYSDEGEYYLLSYTGTDAEITLPELTIDGQTVNYSIYEKAFYNNTTITSVTVPDSVTSIGDAAFGGCSSLVSITLPFAGSSASADSASASTLFGYIFGTSTYTGGTSTRQYYSSSSYATYYIPSTLTTVTITGGNLLYGAFYNCSTLESITIGENVTSIGNYAFYYCTALTEINYNAASINNLSRNNYAFTKAGQNGNGIVATIGANVAIIPGDLFCPSASYSGYEPNITSVVFAEGSVCESIGGDAFFKCNSLTSVYYNGTASQWASITFGDDFSNPLIYACNLYLKGTLVTDITLENISAVSSYAFINCTSLKTVTIDSGATAISYESFYGCTSLESITIPDSVTSIGYNAFYECTSLKSVTIPDGVTSIGDYAFRNCTALTEINYNAMTIEGLYSDDGVFTYAGQNGITVNIGANVTNIPAYLFYSTNVIKVVFEDNNACESIGDYAFYDCTLLSTLTIGANLNSIGDYAFYNCALLTSITIPASLNSIGDKAFRACINLVEIYNLSSLTITAGSTDNGYVGYYAKNIYTSESGSSNITTQDDYIFYNDNGTYYLIGYAGSDTALTLPALTIGGKTVNYAVDGNAFYQNTRITSVTIPDGVTSIGYEAFCYCTSLESVTIGNSVTSIEDYAFYGCTSLTSVTVSNNVTSFGYSAFQECHSLESVYYNGNASQWATITFKNDYSNPMLYAANLYLNGSLVTDITLEGISAINAYAFYGCTALKSVTIPSSVTAIGSYAFNACFSLTSVTV